MSAPACEEHPAFIRCEGSGHPPAARTDGMCAMCGTVFGPVEVVPEHQRDDVLARLDRGDFG